MFQGEDTITFVFWLCAIVGSVFFVLKGVLTIVSGADFDLDVETDSDIVDGHDTEVAFKVLSLTSVSAFIMMFGWSGLAAYKEYGFSAALTVLVAFVVGTASMFATAYLFKLALKLKSDGATFDKTSIIGKTAKVYHEIPADGSGRVQITVGGFVRELDAVSADQTAIKSFETVEVVELVNQHTVSVKLVKNQEGEE